MPYFYIRLLIWYRIAFDVSEEDLTSSKIRSTIYLLSSKFPKSTNFFFFPPRSYRSYRSYQYRFFPTFLYNKETACHGRVCSVGLPTSGKLVGLSLAICWDRYMYCFIFKKKKEMKTSTFEASFVPVTVMEIASLHTYLWVNTPYHLTTQQYYFISGGLVHREGL